MEHIRTLLLFVVSMAGSLADVSISDGDGSGASHSKATAKCGLYPSCVAQPKEKIPADGLCCPTSGGEQLDCCAAGLAREPNVTQYNASTAVCVIDVMQAAQMLGRAGTSLNAAVKVCIPGKATEQTHNQIARCATPVADVVSSFSYAASFLSLAARECAESLHLKDFMKDTLGISPGWVDAAGEAAQLQAACAGAVTSFTAGLSQIAESGSAITQSCEWMKSYGPVLANRTNESNAGETTISAQELAENATFVGDSKKEIRQQQEAQCAFDVGQATMFLAQAGTQINSAVFDCSDYKLKEGGKHAKAMCAVDTSGVIQSFGFVASLVSFAVTNCPYFQINLDAGCSGAIANAVTGISGIAAASAAFRDTCQTISNATRAIFGV